MATSSGSQPGPRHRLGADRVIALLCLGIVLLYGWGGSELSAALQGDVIGPALFPAVLAAFGVLLCVVLFINGGPASRADASGDDAAGTDVTGAGAAIAPATASNPDPDPDLPALVPAGLLLAYVLAFEWLGFMLSTVVFLTVTFRYLGHPRWRSALAYAVLATGVIFLVFHMGLGIKLPPSTLLAFGRAF
ncbi:MAG: tripartite tricarboxylate transporter TctB family protein [bacterium]|jgi:putative tricarboxylic transport membrane protein|nr:tripartite tricarboxylate transporter TctB family protein [Betaproteobacteria bacterium]